MGFRQMITDSETLVLAGKSAKNNEELIEQVGENEEVFHTAEIGSPFVNIKGKAKRGDLKEAATFCAKYSKDWKKNKKDVFVHRFKGKEIYNEKSMKLGTLGIKKFKVIKVKKEDIQKWQQ